MKGVGQLAKFCMKCGATLESNVKFCTKCGAPVNGENNVYGMKNQSTVQGAQSTFVKPGKQNHNKIAWGVGIVALVIIGIGGFFFYTQNVITVKDSVQTEAVSETESKDKAHEDSKSPGAESVSQSASGKPSDANMDKAKKELAEYGINGEFKYTSYGHSNDGFVAVDNAGQIVVIDRKNHRVGTVKSRMSLAEFQNQKGNPNPKPIILECTFSNDMRDGDVNAGYWRGNTHYMNIYALYKFDSNGNIIPGMLTTASGEHPSHYHEVLYEVRNVDFANLFLTEAISLKM